MNKKIQESINSKSGPATTRIEDETIDVEEIFDENDSEFTYEELLEMVKTAKAKRKEQKKEVVTLRISSSALKKAKATGKGYTSFLGRLLENALNDKDLVMRSL